nr:TPA: gp81-like protein [Oryctes rhinoceros nudivirus]
MLIPLRFKVLMCETTLCNVDVDNFVGSNDAFDPMVNNSAMVAEAILHDILYVVYSYCIAMYVTIDSNVANIPQLIASKIGQSSARWCSDLNVCDAFTELRNNGGKIDSNQNAMQVYFNTPISMSTDVDEYTMPPNTIHFVYLDYAINTYALRMILNNIKKLRNVIIITNGNSYSYGQYVLTVGNCTLDDIADVISGIIVVHIRENRTVDERELVALICGETCDSTTCRTTESKKYNIYNILDSKRVNYGEIPDCYECKI